MGLNQLSPGPRAAQGPEDRALTWWDIPTPGWGAAGRCVWAPARAFRGRWSAGGPEPASQGSGPTGNQVEELPPGVDTRGKPGDARSVFSIALPGRPTSPQATWGAKPRTGCTGTWDQSPHKLPQASGPGGALSPGPSSAPEESPPGRVGPRGGHVGFSLCRTLADPYIPHKWASLQTHTAPLWFRPATVSSQLWGGSEAPCPAHVTSRHSRPLEPVLRLHRRPRSLLPSWEGRP